MEVGRAYFETDKKHFTILDAPGHKERNISCNYHLNLKFTCSYSVKYVRDFISVRIRIQLNPDPAKILNPDPDPEDPESGTGS